MKTFLIFALALSSISLAYADGDKPTDKPAAEVQATDAGPDFKTLYDEFLALGHLIDEENAALAALQSKQDVILKKLRAAIPPGKNYDPAKNGFTPVPKEAKPETK